MFKRVAEGVATFDAIYDKVQSSGNPSQKEKLESDLKREIKKLQRLRDQIKTWMGSNEVKDKKALTEQRRLIESEMERFKACEKEMKTKAYSKEGLINSSRLDPKDQEKADTSGFVSSMIEELDRQIESLEAEQETLQAGMKKGRKADHSKQERISDIENAIERHRWHQGRMEVILRMVENGTLECDKVNGIQEDIKYYVESNQDADFAEDDEIYEELNLEDEPFDMDYEGSRDGDGAERQDEDFDDMPVSGMSTNNTASTPTVPHASPAVVPMNDSIAVRGGTGAITSINNKKFRDTSGTLPGPVPSADSGAGVRIVSSSKKQPLISIPGSTAGPGAASTITHIVTNKPSMSISTGSIGSHSQSAKIPPGLSPLPPPSSTPAGTAAGVNGSRPSDLQANRWISTNDIKEAKEAERVKGHMTTSAASTPLQSHAQPAQTPAPMNDENKAASQQPQQQAPEPTPKSIPQLLSFSLPPGLQDLAHAFDDARTRLASPPPIEDISMLLNASFLNCPDSSVADIPRYYHPSSPFPTPPYYPQEPLTNLDDPRIVAKMDLDTLFYVFYYRQGTYQQYLAAKELKARSWRFHKRFMTWFQRHEEPKIISHEYEQGTYRFFDYEGSWMQRRKQNFKFEYQYLEDEL